MTLLTQGTNSNSLILPSEVEPMFDSQFMC